MQKEQKDRKAKTRKLSSTVQKLNADLPTPGKSSILKNRHGSGQFEKAGKILVPALNLKLDSNMGSNEADAEKALMASSANSPGRFLATITDEEETIASKQRASDQLLVRAKRHASKEWYLAASDEEYSIPGDHDQKTVTNTVNTSTHQGLPLMSTRNVDMQNTNFISVEPSAFFTDRNRPTSAASMNQMQFNRPLRVRQRGPAYQTAANFFDQDNADQTMQSYHSQPSLSLPQGFRKPVDDAKASKIKIKKIKLPKLKKNKELNSMIKDL